MEQPPKMPTEQFDLFDEKNLPAKSAEQEPAPEMKLEDRAMDELERLFEEKVGFSARTRFVGQSDDLRRAVLIEGILDPKKGKDAVAEWDAEYDKIGDAWSGK